AASLALGKTSTKTAHVALLLEALTPTTSRPDAPSWESALALGLLRRERPAERMAPRDLKRVREVLLTTVGGEAGPDLVRGAAALALGLLADQGAEDAAHVAPRLAEVLEQDDAAPDLRVACLVALGHHPRAAIDERILQCIRLRAAANGERVRHQPRIVAVYAVLALGRLGDAADVDLLLRTALFSRRGMPRRNESAAIALGALAARVDEDTRRRIHEALRKALTKQPHRSSPGFALISQGRIALAALRASPPKSVLAEQAVAGLRARLETGGRRARPFACLALARIARTIGSNEDDESLRDMRERILQVLRRNLMSKRLGERERAAVALALGLAQDEDRADALHELAASPSSPPPIAAYAALGHGLLGSATKATHRTLRGLVDPRQPRVVRHQAARALGLLHDRDVGARVRSALAAADSNPVKHELLVTLGEVGTETDVEPLLAYVLDAERDPALRARACAALGRVGDLERVPSVTRLVNGMNHRAATLLMAQVWDLQ
nr:hypothetical protein [Planctomycetota bacterium]